ncbi:MAG: hypothetical protein K1X28_06125 [Parachlamydiales bacterium]|nr:hypothetical protein [Parachlamydiales bacterium]
MIKALLALFCLTSLIAEEKFTTHTLKMGEETLNYTATVSTGKVSYISYVVQTTENRPITFIFNGGPGSSSIWLHMAALGPRIFVGPEEGGSLVPPYKIADNLETILDLTDLVFIDPSATGFSENDESCFTVQKDIEAVSNLIRDYLTQNGRWNSPKYIGGESYGALRASGVAEYLAGQYGIYLNGILLISPAIDYQVFIFETDNQLPYLLYLPTYATTAWYHKKAHSELTVEEVAQKARDFTYRTYAQALLCPKCTNIETLYPELAEITGLSIEDIKLNRGKLADWVYSSTLLQSDRKMIGRFDSRATGPLGRYVDPSLANIEGPLSAVMHEYLHKELEFRNSYTLFSEKANAKWNHHDYNEWGYPNLLSGLRRACVSNPSMKLFVGCGYYDLATPFATAEYCIDHLDVPNVSVQMEYYEGGHMYYSNPKARVKFKQDLTRFYVGK